MLAGMRSLKYVCPHYLKTILRSAVRRIGLLAICFSVLICMGCSVSSVFLAPEDTSTPPIYEGACESLSINNVKASNISVKIEGGSGCLCMVTACDASGAVIASASHYVAGDSEIADIGLELPPTPAIYSVRAFLFDSDMMLRCKTSAVTAAMYSDIVSSSHVSGLFIAPELSSEATEEQWMASLQSMADIGIDTLIVQYCYQSDSRYGHQAYFHFDADEDTVSDADLYPRRRDQISYILSAAQKLGMKVYLGLQIAEYEWFDRDSYQDIEWLHKECRFSMELADSLWSSFGVQYGDTVAGWYLPFEFESGEEYYPYFEQLTQAYYSPLTSALKEKYSELSIMISPLNYKSDSKTAWQNNLELVLGGSQIDIIAPQDGIGYGTQNHDTLSEWWVVTRAAVDNVNRSQSHSISLWGNCENYARLRNPNESNYTERIKPMSISKFITSLDVAAPYTDKLVSFSLHRWDTKLSDDSAVGVNQPYYEAYKRYYVTGQKPVSLAEGYFVDIFAKQNGTLRFNATANAGLTDGAAADPDDWHEYRGIGIDGGETFVMQILFDDTIHISRVSSNYYEDLSSAVVLPVSVKYEYLLRSGENDEIFTYTQFYEEPFADAKGITASVAVLDAPTQADGIRITVSPGGEWTFLDDVLVK